MVLGLFTPSDNHAAIAIAIVKLGVEPTRTLGIAAELVIAIILWTELE